jgi:hypothetical protein
MRHFWVHWRGIATFVPIPCHFCGQSGEWSVQGWKGPMDAKRCGNDASINTANVVCLNIHPSIHSFIPFPILLPLPLIYIPDARARCPPLLFHSAGLAEPRGLGQGKYEIRGANSFHFCVAAIFLTPPAATAAVLCPAGAGIGTAGRNGTKWLVGKMPLARQREWTFFVDKWQAN